MGNCREQFHMNKETLPQLYISRQCEQLHMNEIPVRHKSFRLWTNFTLEISQSPAPCVTAHLTRAALIHDSLTISMTTPLLRHPLILRQQQRHIPVVNAWAIHFYVNKNVIYTRCECASYHELGRMRPQSFTSSQYTQCSECTRSHALGRMRHW
jgi:hypothetical protein